MSNQELPMKRIATFLVKKRIIVLCVFAALAVSGAAMMPFVNINYDLTQYLPDDFKSKQALEIMTEEFGDVSPVDIVFKGITEEQAAVISKELGEFEGITAVLYDAGSADYRKDDYTRFTLTVGHNAYSEEAINVVNTIRDRYQSQGLTVYTVGMIVENDISNSTLFVAILVAFAILMVILFVASSSWLDPLIYLITIGAAVLINMGTNLFFSSVSSMTESVTAILQLVLSMDYSIMLITRYRQERLLVNDPETAMINAIQNGFAPIASSSVTTIVGLLCLIFMSFTIGVDMGIVLAKGVLISLLCVFTVLPALTLMLDKYLYRAMKKRKRNLIPLAEEAK